MSNKISLLLQQLSCDKLEVLEKAIVDRLTLISGQEDNKPITQYTGKDLSKMVYIAKIANSSIKKHSIKLEKIFRGAGK